MSSSFVRVRGAREHNLRGVSLELPRNRLICFTGVSGSGKSSLAFDTLYAEGQRRYVESLSAYARQFLGQLAKPDVDQITGLSPSIAIQQKSTGWNPRSTVGTVTGIYDFLRVLYARVGRQHCPQCGRLISAQTQESIIERILTLPEGVNVLVLAPVVRGQKGEHVDLLDDLRRRGYVRARIDGKIVHLSDAPKLGRHNRHDIEVVIDRLTLHAGMRPRLAEAVESALILGEGTLIIAPAEERGQNPPSPPLGKGGKRGRGAAVTGSAVLNVAPQDGRNARPPESLLGDASLTRDLVLSSKYACVECGIGFEMPSPQLFSFNSPTGMCLECDGMGTSYEFDPALLVPDPSLDFFEPCVAPMRTRPGRWRRHIFNGVAKHVGFDINLPWKELPAKARKALLFGTGEEHITFEWRTGRHVWKHGGTFAGVIAELKDKYRQAKADFVREYYEQFMRQRPCASCGGQRLNAQARAVRIGGANLPELCALSVRAAREFFGAATSDPAHPPQPPLGKGGREAAAPEQGGSAPAPPSAGRRALELTATEALIATEVLKEVRGRLEFLANVGLEYLTLDRTAPTLAGGESQRIRLAAQIGCGLTGVLYVLDEPSIGLHPRDNVQLLESLKRLRDMGNTVIVVEHDEETMRAADLIVDFGPGPGVRGGHVVATGTIAEIAAHEKSLTGQYLSGQRAIEVPKQRRPVTRLAASRATPGTNRATPASRSTPEIPDRAHQSAKRRVSRKSKGQP